MINSGERQQSAVFIKAGSDKIIDTSVIQHDLPDEIQELTAEETVCKFCGVSYLIHREMKQMEDKVEYLTAQLKLWSSAQDRAVIAEERFKDLQEKFTNLERSSKEERSVLQSEKTKLLLQQHMSKMALCEHMQILAEFAARVESEQKQQKNSLKSEQEKFKSLNEKLATCQADLSSSKSKLLKVEIALTSEQKKTCTLTQEVSTSKTECDRLEKELKLLQKDVAADLERSTQLKSAAARSAETDQENKILIKSMKSELERQKGKLSELEKKYGILQEKSAADLQAAAAVSGSEVASLKEEKSSLEAELRGAKAELSGVQLKVDQLTETRRDLDLAREELGRQEELGRKLEKEIDEMKNAQQILVKCQQDLTTVSRERDESNKQNELIRGELERLHGDVTSRGEEIGQLKEEVAQLRAAATQLSDEKRRQSASTRAFIKESNPEKVRDLEERISDMSDEKLVLELQLKEQREMVTFLTETVRRECEERLLLSSKVTGVEATESRTPSDECSTEAVQPVQDLTNQRRSSELTNQRTSELANQRRSSELPNQRTSGKCHVTPAALRQQSDTNSQSSANTGKRVAGSGSGAGAGKPQVQQPSEAQIMRRKMAAVLSRR